MANIDTDNFNIFSYYSTCMMIAGHDKNPHAHFGLTALLLCLPEVILNQPKVTQVNNHIGHENI